MSFIENCQKLVNNILEKNKNKLYVMFNYYPKIILPDKKEGSESIFSASLFKLYSCKEGETNSIFTASLKGNVSASTILVIIDYDSRKYKKILSKINEITKMLSNKIILCISNLDENTLNTDFNEFVPINLDYVSAATNHIISANFQEYDFKKMKQEIENKGYVTWLNSSVVYERDENKKILKEEKIKDKKRSHKFNIGDDVYIYYTKLPPNNKSAILLRATVINNGYYNNNYQKELCFFNGQIGKQTVKPKDGFYAIKLELKKSLKREEPLLKFDSKFIEKLETKVQGKVTISDTNSQLQDLQFAFNSNMDSLKILNRLTEYFGVSCTLEDCEGIGNHKTFTRANGLPYYELHHLIERNNKELTSIIEEDYNIFPLCSNCHNRIHYGEKKDREIMVRKLFEKNKEHYLKAFEAYPEYKGHEFEKILEQYL